MSDRKLGQDFADLKKEVRKIPEMADYLDSYSVAIGNLVFARRMQLGLSQSELAKLSNTSQAQISKIEAGDDSITAKVLNRVFRALKLQSLHPVFDNEETASIENYPEAKVST